MLKSVINKLSTKNGVGFTLEQLDYVRHITMDLKGHTGINFQLTVKKVLEEYWKSKGKTFEMPNYYGGDEKNDGWVTEEGIFYQMYAPTMIKSTIKGDIQNKFSNDLDGLLNKICNNGKWGGRIREFIFIVNTIDNNLPEDSERFFEHKVNELEKKYGVKFNYKVVNIDYIYDVLGEIEDIDILKTISYKLDVYHSIDPNGISEKIIIDLICSISGNLNDCAIYGQSLTSYTRVSSDKKIGINNLNDLRERIEKFISKLDTVENAIKIINEDVLAENKFDRVKGIVIKTYEDLSKKYSGSDLYNSMIDKLLSYSDNMEHLKTATELLVVYIFDKCDIFEKEGDV